MPTKNTTVLTVRVPDEVVNQIREKIARKGMTTNQFLNWAINLGLRKHGRK